MGTYAVTGSASGIGAATRDRLQAAGHRVIGVDLRDADTVADLGTAAGRTAAVDTIVEQSGGVLDGLVTAAGWQPPVEAVQIASTNYFGTVALLTGLHAALAAAGSAQVVTVSSNSTTTMPGVPANLVDACLADDEESARAYAAHAGVAETYAATKTAVARYVRRHAPTAEWAGRGIRLNSIAPGATLTPGLQTAIDSDEFGQAIRDFPIPTGGYGTADQIAFWIDAMLTGEGAGFLCGSVLFVDGGTDAQLRADDWPSTYSTPGS